MKWKTDMVIGIWLTFVYKSHMDDSVPFICIHRHVWYMINISFYNMTLNMFNAQFCFGSSRNLLCFSQIKYTFSLLTKKIMNLSVIIVWRDKLIACTWYDFELNVIHTNNILFAQKWIWINLCRKNSIFLVFNKNYLYSIKPKWRTVRMHWMMSHNKLKIIIRTLCANRFI